MHSLKKLLMHNRVTYEYAIIRLVPKVEREEFINIGVVLFSKRKKYLDMKYKLDKAKIELFSDDIDIVSIQKYLDAWKLVCEGSIAGGRIAQLDQAFRFRWLVAKRSTIIQSSVTHSGLCEEPERVLVELHERYVL